MEISQQQVIDYLSNLTVMQIAELTKSLEDKWGVKAAPVAVAGAAAAPAEGGGAKAEVTRILSEWFGWKDVIDLGDITNARGTEMYLPLWVRLFGTLATPSFNIKVVR